MPPLKQIGVLTGGGDAPGLNAVIRAVVKSAWNSGIATLGMARHLARTPMTIEELAVLGCRFLEDGMRRS